MTQLHYLLLTDVVAWPTATPAMPAMLKMFSQTYTARKDPGDRAPEDRSRKIPHFVVFSPWLPWPFTFDPQIEIGWDFCTMRLTAKFHCPAFNRSEVIVFTYKLTDAA